MQHGFSSNQQRTQQTQQQNFGSMSHTTQTNGGHLQSPAAADSANQQPSPSKKKSQPTWHPYIPVTIRQIMNATQVHGTDSFKIDGHDVYSVSVIGVIQDISQQTINFVYRVDDGTTTMALEVHHWLNQEEDPDTFNKAVNTFKKHMYVKVWGALKHFNSKRSLSVHKIFPISGNQISLHYLEVIYAHLYFTKGALQITQHNTQFVPNQITTTTTTTSTSNTNPSNSLRNMLKDVITKCDREIGYSVGELCELVGQPDNVVYSVLEQMVSDLEIFNPDQDYYKSVEKNTN